jgi:hypothetical protein
LNAVILAPSLRRSLTRLFWATPLILVKLPPATILLPTWTMAATLPSSTCGVQSAGLLDTTAGCGTLTAAPGRVRRAHA